MSLNRPINLNRCFTAWSNQERGPLDVELLGGRGLEVGWPAILDEYRVVILAEAGAGKTTEMKIQIDLLRRDGRFAFFGTVQDIGAHGLRDALGPEMGRDYDAWRPGDNRAWFFIDSVDEARLNHIQLHTALRKVAAGIDGAERRAHIVLSSRYTDWDFRVDQEIFNEILPTQSQDRPPAPTPEELLGYIVRHDKPPEPPPKIDAVVLVMKPLDEARVRLYATESRARDIESFVATIGAADLWRFARRPLDLSWMVEFWRTHGRLGRFAEMLDTSLSSRAMEWNVRRGRDPLDAERSRRALERIGAALVFVRAQTVSIPTIGVSLDPTNDVIDLRNVLPDWSQDDVQQLLGRPAFVPSSFGRARLHNDNEGEVRSFLAAQWLKRLKNANCPLRSVQHLLFAEVYENALIRPSARGTAAWLSLWDDDIARVVVARDPLLLMNGGDPASLSLSIRRKVLEGLVSRLVADPDLHPIYDHDKLRRFTTSELSELIRHIWFSQDSTSSVRSLLLMMIWLGRLVSCIDLALNAALTVDGERMEQLFGARAVTTVGDVASRAQLADHIRKHAVRLPPLVVWDTLEHLFPAYLTIDDLLFVLDRVPGEIGYGFRFDGPMFATKLNSADQLTFFIEAILVRGRRIAEPAGTSELKGVAGLFGPALAVAAMRLMKRSPDDQAPTAAIDAYLWLNKDRYAQRARETAELSLKEELCRTSIRRRTTFWRAAERLNGPSLYDSQPMNNYLLLEFYGWPGGLELNDLDWLLQDMLLRGSEDDHRLALSAAHWVWQNNKSDPEILTQISSAAQQDPNLKKLHELWVSPRAQDHEIQRFITESAAQKAEHEAEQVKRDASWWQFIEEMRADMAEIRTIRPRADNTVDGRLYNLWKLARSACAKDSKFEFDSLVAIQPVLGAGLTEALNHALVAFWRSRRPVLRSDRPPGERNHISDLDSMAISAISLEARGNSSWAVSLTFDDAALAAQFATLELNGFPTWLGGLANEQPSAVASVLVREVVKRLNETDSTWLDVLERLTRADLPVVKAVGPDLLNALEERPDILGSLLQDLIEVLIRGLPGDQVLRLRNIVLGRAMLPLDLGVSGTYFAAAFACDPEATIDRLTYRLDRLPPIDQTTLATAFLPKLFGADIFRNAQIGYTFPFDVLTRLVLIASRTIRVHEDLNRPSFEVYSPTARDSAEGARAAAFERLFETPGRETYDILLQLAETKDFPIPPRRLRELARRRAFLDADGQAWAPDEVLSFETEFERPPRTAFELQQLLLSRLCDLNHELLHGDFSLGRNFKLLPDETAVQNWVARELRTVQRKSYSVDREVHRAFEKEPDIVARAKASDASVAVEIKIVDRMSVKELEHALSSQLCDRYLRARDGRHGILLLVYRHMKADGWRDPKSGKLINFEAVLDRLHTLALRIANGQGDVPQPVLAVLNTSSL